MKHTCFQPPSHTDTQCFGSYSPYARQSRSLLWHTASQNTLCTRQRGRHCADPAPQSPPSTGVPALCPKLQRMKLGKKYLHFPTELTWVPVMELHSFPVWHISESISHCYVFPCPHRTPAPNLILKHFEGNLCACKQAGAIPSRSHALVLVSSDAANKMGNRIIFTTEDYFIY